MTQDPNLTPEQEDELTLLAEELDEVLRSAGAASAEAAFGIGFGLGVLPLGVLILVLFATRVIDLISTIILSALGVMILVTIATSLSVKARANTIQKAFNTSVKDEIAQYLAGREMSRQHFDTLVHQLLPPDAPLQAYLSPILPPDNDLSEE